MTNKFYLNPKLRYKVNRLYSIKPASNVTPKNEAKVYKVASGRPATKQHNLELFKEPLNKTKQSVSIGK